MTDPSITDLAKQVLDLKSRGSIERLRADPARDLAEMVPGWSQPGRAHVDLTSRAATRFERPESELGPSSPAGALRCLKPLSPLQQLALFRELRRPGMSARKRHLLRSRLVVGTFPIVLHCLRRVADRQRLAELVQEGLLALVHAVDVFVATRYRDDFTRFAIVRVARWLRGIQRSWDRERALLVDAPIEDIGEDEVSDPFSATSQVELEQRLETLISRLPDVEQRVLLLRFGIGVREAQSREAISRELRLEQHRVRYLEERALLTLRRGVERQRALARAVRHRSRATVHAARQPSPFASAEVETTGRTKSSTPLRPLLLEPEPEMRLAPLRADPTQSRVWVRGIEVVLTPTEFRLLNVLMQEPGRVLTHRHLLRQVWGSVHSRETQHLRVYVRQLREKIELDPAHPELLVTSQGVGYRLNLMG